MAGIGILIAWLGYGLGYYGVDQIRGGNNGLMSLLIPGKYSNQPNDSGGAAGSGAGGAAVSGLAPNAGNPGSPNIIEPTSAPKGAPPGTYGVDTNGTTYVKKNGSWTVYSAPNGQQLTAS